MEDEVDAVEALCDARRTGLPVPRSVGIGENGDAHVAIVADGIGRA